MELRKKINVLVVEENTHYNKLLSKALLKHIRSLPQHDRFELSFHSFTDPVKCKKKISTHEWKSHDIVAFVDCHAGKEISGDYFLNMFQEYNNNTLIILLSQPGNIKEVQIQNNEAYFIVKDTFAPALCCLYLEQYLENKI